MQIIGIVFGKIFLFFSFSLRLLLLLQGRKLSNMRDQDDHQPAESKLGVSIHACLHVLSIARLLARTHTILKQCDFSHLLFSTVHIHSPRRVRESRVIAVTIAAAAAVDVVVTLL